MEIEMLREAGEDGGGFMGFWTKGHHDIEAFYAAVVAYDHTHFWPRDREDKEAISPWMIRQGWWRCVPIAGEGGVMYADAAPSSRGAFRVTYVNTSEVGVIKWEAEKRWGDVEVWKAAADYSLDNSRSIFCAFRYDHRKAGSLVALNREHACAEARAQIGTYAENLTLVSAPFAVVRQDRNQHRQDAAPTEAAL